MKARQAAVEVVHGAFEAVVGRPLDPPSVLYDVLLGKHGLGLDSIEIVEALIACEDSIGTPIGTLVEQDPLTFGAVVEHFTAE